MSKSKPFKVPGTIKVLGHIWTIKRVKGLYDSGNMGQALHTDRCIELDAGLEPGPLERVFLHELFHAYQLESGIADGIGRQLMEVLAEGQTNFILSVFNLSLKKQA